MGYSPGSCGQGKSLRGARGAAATGSIDRVATVLRVSIGRTPASRLANPWSHHAGPTIQSTLRVGDALTLVREPHHPHDPRTVRLDHGDTTIGYIPSAINHEAAARLDEGTRLDARVYRVDREAPAWGRVLVEIRYTA
jgi:hypothetical protein